MIDTELQDALGNDEQTSPFKHVERRTLSRRFRSIVENSLPGLNDNPEYWRLFGYLLFGSSFDEDSGNLLIGQPKLAKVLGENANNFLVLSFLKRFQRDVMPAGSFGWTQYNPFRAKCTQVKHCVWPAAIENAIPHEIAREWHEEGRVYLDGSAYSEPKRRLARQADRAEAERQFAYGPDAKMIQRYMNQRESNLFTVVVDRNYAAALAAANNIKKRRSRRAQRRMLRRIADQQQPFYSPSFDGNTVRLFASEHIPNLQGDVRRALTPEWPEADLKSSQLAICARLWEVPVVLRFLETGNSVWEHLARWMDIPADQIPEAKKVLKEAVYSVCYGKLRPHVQGDVTRGLKKFGFKQAGPRFLQNEIVSALLDERDVQIDRINRQGGAVDCYGKPILVGRGREAKQILAELAQAVEMKLIAPIFKLAEFNENFKIMLYQFDGVSIHFGKKEREGAWRRKIEDVVKKEAESLNILTELEWKN